MRVEAASALWRIDRQGDLVLPVLVDSLKSKQPQIWDTARKTFWSLGWAHQGKGAISALLEALRDPDAEVRERAAS